MSDTGRLALGLSAESFHKTFGVGAVDWINPVDGVGVALAAIQGLHGLIDGQADELRRLRERIESAERKRAAERAKAGQRGEAAEHTGGAGDDPPGPAAAG